MSEAAKRVLGFVLTSAILIEILGPPFGLQVIGMAVLASQLIVGSIMVDCAAASLITEGKWPWE